MSDLLSKRDRLIKDSFNSYGLDHDLIMLQLDEVNMQILRLNFKRK